MRDIESILQQQKNYKHKFLDGLEYGINYRLTLCGKLFLGNAFKNNGTNI